MNTKTYHSDNFGWFAVQKTIRNPDGTVTFHDHDRYRLASSGELREWMWDGSDEVVNAAILELDARDLGEWASRY